ncbi:MULTISPECIES: DUF397 domain-containing protein [Streptomyces]|uniref:DUF397 domain-containing protein n=1 Tax=Streptomyces edwardsiae TaxID=3075527 RepID=A0ABU2Q371_9ACTN|nr:DUF397 domain-containing protein [Streptomyces sp. DSM 41636]MDT0398886.1 DUF397 domain-containing protein [Streptomyces sp. DSM 41636]
MRVTRDLSTVRWRKSSYSDGQEGGACVEVRDDFPGTVPVRDSKNPTGPVMVLDGAAWQPFIDGVKGGSL